MKRLEKHEIRNLKVRLAEWQPPQIMHALVSDTADFLGLDNLFNQGGLAFLRDAWIAAEFGVLRNADAVRLVSNEWPDFEVLLGGRIDAFEAVEADDPKRRRGIEYREGIGEVEDDPVEDWIARAEQAPAWLAATCEKKVSKRYGARASLVIYLNLSEFGIRQSEVEACFPSATESAKRSFEEILVLWKKKVYRVWSQSPATL
jgi:hypothetical protein